MRLEFRALYSYGAFSLLEPFPLLCKGPFHVVNELFALICHMHQGLLQKNFVVKLGLEHVNLLRTELANLHFGTLLKLLFKELYLLLHCGELLLLLVDVVLCIVVVLLQRINIFLVACNFLLKESLLLQVLQLVYHFLVVALRVQVLVITDYFLFVHIQKTHLHFLLLVLVLRLVLLVFLLLF